MAEHGESQTVPTSVFNLDLTLAPEARTDLAFDVVEAGLEPVAPEDILGELGFQEQQRMFVRWCKGRTLEDIQPLIDYTRRLAAERIPRWAGLIATREVLPQYGRENDLLFISRVLPQEIVEAYAEGWARDWGLPVPIASGAELTIGSDGTYKGRDDWIDKHSVLLTLTRREGRSYELVAESFTDGIPILRKAEHPLMVNPETSLRDMRMGEMDIIYADLDEPDRVRLQKADEPIPTAYDLDRDDDTEIFLELFYRDEPA